MKYHSVGWLVDDGPQLYWDDLNSKNAVAVRTSTVSTVFVRVFNTPSFELLKGPQCVL